MYFATHDQEKQHFSNTILIRTQKVQRNNGQNVQSNNAMCHVY